MTSFAQFCRVEAEFPCDAGDRIMSEQSNSLFPEFQWDPSPALSICSPDFESVACAGEIIIESLH